MKRAAYVAAAAQLRLNGGPARKSSQFSLYRIEPTSLASSRFRRFIKTAYGPGWSKWAHKDLGCSESALYGWMHGSYAAPLEVVETAERRLARRLIEIDEQAAKDRAAVAVAAQDAKILKAGAVTRYR